MSQVQPLRFETKKMPCPHAVIGACCLRAGPVAFYAGPKAPHGCLDSTYKLCTSKIWSSVLFAALPFKWPWPCPVAEEGLRAYDLYL
eukprot:CAMPEP_0172787974 /NCGR_PEP_ID=MMETSP1074-20121228/206719_1 /TAXON_ID=2916 /ORGANISM="Ceratium fusus, Strain PA161109" /LENGTH=86 /DNA_ID=CAMNT_0013624995 /DNA_START=541 /DNA_END=801 /DNA_ORIENTATION=+